MGGFRLKTILAFIYLHTVVFALPAFAAEPTKAEMIATIDKMVGDQARRLGIPGGAFGLIMDGNVVLKTVAGPRKLSGKELINTETLFQIGSIAKTFAAAIAVQFQEQKKLQLNDPIKKYLADRCKQNQCEGITIANLLNHTSGIPAAGINDSIERGDAYDAIISKALNAKKVCAPGQCFQYNNAAYELVREVLEKLDGRPYADILKKQVLAPLKMTGTSMTFEDLKRSNNYFVPHLFLKNRFEETSHSTAYYGYPGSSMLNANLDDMLRFVTAELGYAPSIISAEALKILHKPTIEAPDAYEWFDKPAPGKGMTSHYAIGHRVLTAPGFTVVFHTGWIKGCKSLIAIFPERNMGIVLLQNSGSQLGFRVLEDIVRYLRTARGK